MTCDNCCLEFDEDELTGIFVTDIGDVLLCPGCHKQELVWEVCPGCGKDFIRANLSIDGHCCRCNPDNTRDGVKL